jgi:hypothetical protein
LRVVGLPAFLQLDQDRVGQGLERGPVGIPVPEKIEFEAMGDPPTGVSVKDDPDRKVQWPWHIGSNREKGGPGSGRPFYMALSKCGSDVG